jgi:hypothetical protein
MKRLPELLGAFWREERSLSVVLALLVLTAFIAGPLGFAARLEVVTQVAFSLLLVSGVAVVSPRRRVLAAALVVLVGDRLVAWLARSYEISGLDLAGSVLEALLVAVMMVVVLVRSVRGGVVTVHRISGAVAAYLLCGLFFAQTFAIVDRLAPGAFTAGPGLEPPLRDWSGFLYFSMITLATLGYGDITPLHPAARSLASLEAFIGQLYPAILISRLVALEMAHHRGESS